MAAPNYPRNGNQWSWPNHRKQTNGGNDLRIIKLIKWTVGPTIECEMSLIVVEAIRGRCASFMNLTAKVSEIFGERQTHLF